MTTGRPPRVDAVTGLVPDPEPATTGARLTFVGSADAGACVGGVCAAPSGTASPVTPASPATPGAPAEHSASPAAPAAPAKHSASPATPAGA